MSLFSVLFCSVRPPFSVLSRLELFLFYHSFDTLPRALVLFSMTPSYLSLFLPVFFSRRERQRLTIITTSKERRRCKLLFPFLPPDFIAFSSILSPSSPIFSLHFPVPSCNSFSSSTLDLVLSLYFSFFSLFRHSLRVMRKNERHLLFVVMCYAVEKDWVILQATFPTNSSIIEEKWPAIYTM